MSGLYHCSDSLTALVGVYIFVRREAGRVLGILAVTLILFGPVWEYSYEARPYGILMGAFMVALVSWQEATRIQDREEHRSRSLALCCMALGILGCVFSHYIGLIEIGFPLIVGEAVRSYYRRRIDWPLVATGLCCLPSVLLIMPMMAHTRNVVLTHSTVLQPPITIHKIFAYFDYARISWQTVMSNQIIGLVILVSLITWQPWANKRLSSGEASAIKTGVRPHVLYASVAASFLIPVTWAALAFGKGWYFCRYGVGSALGIVLFFCLLLAKRKLRSPAFIVGMILVLTFQYVHEFKREFYRRTVPTPANELIESDASALPIVISNPVMYPTTWWYSPAAKKPSVIYLFKTRDSSGDLVTEVLRAETHFFGAPLLDFNSFTRQNSHFILELDEIDGTYDTRKILEAEGFVITPVQVYRTATLFDVDRPAISNLSGSKP